MVYLIIVLLKLNLFSDTSNLVVLGYLFSKHVMLGLGDNKVLLIV